MQYTYIISALTALGFFGLTNAVPAPAPMPQFAGTPPLNGGCNTQHFQEGAKCYAENNAGCSVNGWDVVVCSGGSVQVLQHCGRSSCHETLNGNTCLLSC